jgi:hypothetical protein
MMSWSNAAAYSNSFDPLFLEKKNSLPPEHDTEQHTPTQPQFTELFKKIENFLFKTLKIFKAFEPNQPLLR